MNIYIHHFKLNDHNNVYFYSGAAQLPMVHQFHTQHQSVRILTKRIRKKLHAKLMKASHRIVKNVPMEASKKLFLTVACTR